MSYSILLADDHQMFREGLKAVLQSETDFLVAGEAENGIEAVEQSRELAPDVVIMDISIPELNGGLPVVLMTGHPSMDTALEAMGSAVLAYLLKPIETEELLRYLDTGIRLRKVQALAHESSLRLQTWADEMKAVEADIRSAPASMGVMPLGGLVGLVLGNLASSTLELKQLLDLALQANPTQGVCGIMDCPRLGVYQEALRAGVETLEHTKGAFKSKELADLRKKFSALLEP